MAQLHELLAAEKTTVAAWNTLQTETLKKFGNEHFFNGGTKVLQMIEDSEANKAIEAQAREHKEVPTNVFDTLEYALDIWARMENLQVQKNLTNASARASVEFRGQTLLADMPVDQLLGLESRLQKIRELYAAMPTIDAARKWSRDAKENKNVWVSDPEYGTKTEKIMVPVVLAPATDKHPAQVKESTKDNVVGKFTLIKRSGAVTAVQKSEAIKLVDELLIEIKKARMRANETEVVNRDIGKVLTTLLLNPLKV